MDKLIIPTPIKNIDKILTALYQAQALMYGDLQNRSGMVDDEETQRALSKLHDDRFIRRLDPGKNNFEENMNQGNYQIRYDGVIHHLEGGYEAKIRKAYAENTRLEKIENEQRVNQKWMIVLTVVLTLGTVFPALLAGADLYWNYEWFQSVWWWRIIFLQILLSLAVAGAIAILWRRIRWKK
ncbi:MAG: hypothetical protein IPJ02_00460 [Chitinophagaceae bacterium]|nr:hypothetical protein [Chitinophagaceae bacterium]